jgi:hypothetical protein
MGAAPSYLVHVGENICFESVSFEPGYGSSYRLLTKSALNTQACPPAVIETTKTGREPADCLTKSLKHFESPWVSFLGFLLGSGRSQE